MYGLDARLREPHHRGAGDLQPVAYVPGCLIAVEGLEVVPYGDALVELPEPPGLYDAPKLVLPHQDDLSELPGVSLQVREKAQELQALGAHLLGLVDDQDSVFPAAVALEQEAVKAVHEGLVR